MLATVASQLNYASDFGRSLAVGRQYLDDLKTHGGATEKLIVAHAMLGRTLVQLGRLDEAEDIRRAGVAWPVAPDDRRAQVSQLDLIADLGGLLSRRGKREEAESVLLRGAALGEAQLPLHLARANVLMKLSFHVLDFDPVRALQHAKQASELQATNGTASADTRASTLEVLGLAQAQNGELAAAEASFAQSHALSLSMFGPANRNVARSMGLWSTVIAHRGDHARARQMLAAEVSALAAIDSVAARIATDMLRARQLEIEWLHGDLHRAMAFIGPPPGRDPAPVVPRDGEQIAVLETRALLDAGRTAQAAARIGPVAAGSAQRGLAIGGWFGMAQTLALTQLAQGQPGAARETVRALQALHAQDDGLRSWSAVVSAEIVALAAARGGDTRLAEAELAALEAGPGGPLRAAPAVERAESALRRAEIRQRAGRGELSRDLVRTAMSDLQQQHPDSPRLAQVRALLGAAR